MKLVIDRLLLACLLAASTGAFLLLAVDATFPGENGKVVFSSDRDGDFELYAVEAGG